MPKKEIHPDNQDVNINPTDDEEEEKVAPTPAYIERGNRVDEIAEQAQNELWHGNPPKDDEEEEDDDKKEKKEPPDEVAEKDKPKVDEKEEQKIDPDKKDEVKKEDKEEKPSPDKDEKEEMRTIKVDGVEQQVPLSKIEDAGTRTLQKEATADQRLKEANAKLKEVQEREAKLSPADKVEDVKASEEDETAIAEKVTQIANAFQYESPEEAQQGVRDIVEIVSKKLAENKEEAIPPPTAAEIIQEIKQTEFNDKWATTFPDIKEGSRDYNMVSLEVGRLIEEEGLSVTDWNTYETAADSILKMRGKSRKSEKSKETFEEKKEKKKGIDNVDPVNLKTDTTKKPEPDESASDIINEIKKERGQTP